MNKKYFISALAIMVVCACTKENPSNEQMDGINNEGDKISVEFSAGFGDTTKSKAFLGDKNVEGYYPTLWENTDKISVLDGVSNNLFSVDRFTDPDKKGYNAAFTGNVTETETYYALYPYQENATLDGEYITATLPDIQTATVNSYDPTASLMIARTTGESLYFRNVCSTVRITVDSKISNLTKITIKSNNNTALAGKIKIKFNAENDPEYTVTDGKYEVILQGKDGSIGAGIYYIPILPGTHADGICATFNYSDGRIQKTSNTTMTFNRNTLKPIGTLTNPTVIFPGITSSLDNLDPEAKTAVNWMLDNVKNSAYVPFTVISDNETNNVLSNCDVLWWHFHRDWSVNGLNDNENNNGFTQTTSAYLTETTLNVLKNWNANGGSMFLTRYAVYLANRMGVNSKVPDTFWGGTEQGESGWEVSNNDNQWFYVEGNTRAGSPYFKNCLTKDNNEYSVFMHAANEGNYYLSNSTCHYSTTDYAGFNTETGNTVIAKTSGESQQVIGWECPQAKGQGLVTCFSTPLYDWYSTNGSWEYADGLCHNNVMTITSNAIEYLKTK